MTARLVGLLKRLLRQRPRLRLNKVLPFWSLDYEETEDATEAILDYLAYQQQQLDAAFTQTLTQRFDEFEQRLNSKGDWIEGEYTVLDEEGGETPFD